MKTKHKHKKKLKTKSKTKTRIKHEAGKPSGTVTIRLSTTDTTVVADGQITYDFFANGTVTRRPVLPLTESGPTEQTGNIPYGWSGQELTPGTHTNDYPPISYRTDVVTFEFTGNAQHSLQNFSGYTDCQRIDSAISSGKLRCTRSYVHSVPSVSSSEYGSETLHFYAGAWYTDPYLENGQEISTVVVISPTTATTTTTVVSVQEYTLTFI